MFNPEVREALCEVLDDDALFFDSEYYDNSIVGYTDTGCVVYDYNKMIEELMQDTGMDFNEAVEWVEYNTIRALDYINEEHKPVIMFPIEELI